VTFYGSAALSGQTGSSDISSALTAAGKFQATINLYDNFFMDIGAVTHLIVLILLSKYSATHQALEFNGISQPIEAFL
jgi:hypothetical protein